MQLLLKIRILIIFLLLLLSGFAFGQNSRDTLPSKVTLSQCLSYALSNQQLIKQSMLDEEIARKDINIALSGWYPQLEVDGNLEHYMQIPVEVLGGKAYQSEPPYLSIGMFSINQTLYSTPLLFAAKTSGFLKTQASQTTESTKIDIYSGVTKAFYNVLFTESQIQVLDRDIIRLDKNYKDAYARYQDGLSDNIDYQRAEIALNNSKAEKRTAMEGLKSKYAILKQNLGLPATKQLTVEFDTAGYEKEILMDTTLLLDYSNRIEYKLVQTSLDLQSAQISFYRWSFLPTLSAFYNYSPEYFNNQLSNLYSYNDPASLFGLKFTLPLFQGLNKVENISKAKIQYQRLQYGLDYLKTQLNSEYVQAMSDYRSNLNELEITRKNLEVAKNVYNTIKFQYDKGIKAYLEVIVAESDFTYN